MDELPVVEGLIVCDRIETDPQTRNVSVINRFTLYRTDRLPSLPRSFSVYAALTNGCGLITLTLAVEHLASSTEVYRMHRHIQFVDPLHEVQFILHLPGFIFPNAGSYQFSLYADDEPLTRQLFRVIRV